MIGQFFFDTMMVALSLGKSCKLLPATLNSFTYNK